MRKPLFLDFGKNLGHFCILGMSQSVFTLPEFSIIPTFLF